MVGGNPEKERVTEKVEGLEFGKRYRMMGLSPGKIIRGSNKKMLTSRSIG